MNISTHSQEYSGVKIYLKSLKTPFFYFPVVFLYLVVHMTNCGYISIAYQSFDGLPIYSINLEQERWM